MPQKNGQSHRNRKWHVLHGLYMAFMRETGFEKQGFKTIFNNRVFLFHDRLKSPHLIPRASLGNYRDHYHCHMLNQ
jgi:hypothetical protein